MRRTDREVVTRDLLEAIADAEPMALPPLTAGDLHEVFAALDAYAVPDPSPGATAALIERLRVCVPAPSAVPLEPARRRTRRFRAEGLAASPLTVLGGLLVAQVRLFPPAWWVLTLLVALAWPYAAREIGAPLALLAPPLVAAGLACAFREAGTPAAEMELSCPVRPAHLALVRVLLVMAWVTALGLAGVALGSPAGGAMLTWAAGMLLFGGAGLTLTLWAGPRGALGLGLVAWLALLLTRTLPSVALPGPSGPGGAPLWGLPDARAAALGAALCALGLALAGRLFRLRRAEG